MTEKKAPVREEKQPIGSVYFDARMTQATAQRNRKQLKFNEPGMDMYLLALAILSYIYQYKRGRFGIGLVCACIVVLIS